MRPLVVCCDGTWQSLKTVYPTNVSKIAQGLRPIVGEPVPLIYYHGGIGTGDDPEDRFLGGGFGRGLDTHIQMAYEFLCFNYTSGDEIYLFGFSRGAYTVRSLAGLINHSGLLKREHARRFSAAYGFYREPVWSAAHKSVVSAFKQEFCVPGVRIKLLACFDTVGSLGIPNLIPLVPVGEIVNGKYKFHDTNLSSIIDHALHACAVDERRNAFNLTPMVKNEDFKNQYLAERWFIGDHGCVGGGDQNKALLSNLSLEWMDEQFGELGFPFRIDFSRLPNTNETNPLAPFEQDLAPIFLIEGLTDRELNEGDDVDASASERWEEMANYRPATLQPRLGGAR
jgi:uncharacterized protein (DUF2235 family)